MRSVWVEHAGAQRVGFGRRGARRFWRGAAGVGRWEEVPSGRVADEDRVSARVTSAAWEMVFQITLRRRGDPTRWCGRPRLGCLDVTATLRRCGSAACGGNRGKLVDRASARDSGTDITRSLLRRWSGSGERTRCEVRADRSGLDVAPSGSMERRLGVCQACAALGWCARGPEDRDACGPRVEGGDPRVVDGDMAWLRLVRVCPSGFGRSRRVPPRRCSAHGTLASVSVEWEATFTVLRDGKPMRVTGAAAPATERARNGLSSGARPRGRVGFAAR